MIVASTISPAALHQKHTTARKHAFCHAAATKNRADDEMTSMLVKDINL
jgi:hypothetical protein